MTECKQEIADRICADYPFGITQVLAVYDAVGESEELTRRVLDLAVSTGTEDPMRLTSIVVPAVVIDWDYDAFDTDGQSKFWLYELLTAGDPLPEYVRITGHPWPGKSLNNAMAKLIDADQAIYELMDK